MKRIFVLAMMFFSLFTLTAFAADVQQKGQSDLLQRSTGKIGVIIIGNADVKTSDFFDIISEAMVQSPTDIKKYTVDVGTNVQTEYQNYWLDKGFLDEQPLTKDIILDFVKYSGYDKVLFIIVKDPVIEKTERGSGSWGKETVRRASVEVKAYLADGDAVIKSIDVTKENNSSTSDLRAKRGAFKKNMEEIMANIKDSL
ncbi:hypothetical protein [Pectinatus haikarae]|uniref:Uncharacterized protein n=1 Tax=Pectinatus haikarae TaxID=349096 RepID=A0ABT9Y5L3_9FIRM|nr:hypothetical protein [Pectinatus haikarae]MDQ0203006.1 hypothetical protein [Pectinatus haikarae]